MLSFHRILFPVDFSDRCAGASRYVEALARRFQSEVLLLHVVETHIGQPGDLDFGSLGASLQWEDRLARAEDSLKRFPIGERNHVHVQRRLEKGDPARMIVSIARQEHVNLIMMPTHGYGGFRRFLLGSVTAKVLHDAECPVWTGVHLEQAPPVDSIRISRIMCAVDLTESSRAVINAGIQLGTQFGAELALAHSVPGTEAIPEKLLDCELRRHLLAEGRQRLHELAAEAGVKATVMVESGETGPTIDAMAKAYGSDLLVIGRGQHHGFGRLRTHSYAIIRQSPCPVLSI